MQSRIRIVARWIAAVLLSWSAASAGGCDDEPLAPSENRVLAARPADTGADRHMQGFLADVPFSVNPTVLTSASYDPVRDFTAISLVGVSAQFLYANPARMKSLAELLASAEAKPGQVNFASAGTGNRLSSELFKSAAGIDIVNVPYKGTGQAINDLVAGHVQMMMMNMIAAVPQVKTGKLRGLAVTTLKRSPALPEIPTIAESGLPGFEVTSWHLAIVPVKTPKPIVARLNGALVKIVHLSDVKERLQTQGLEPVGSTPEALSAYMKEESAKYAKLIKQIGLKGE